MTETNILLVPQEPGRWTATCLSCGLRRLSIEDARRHNGSLQAVVRADDVQGWANALTERVDLLDGRSKHFLARKLAATDDVDTETWLSTLDEIGTRLEAEVASGQPFTIHSPYSNREFMRGSLLAICDRPEPPPRLWPVPGLVVEKCVNIWYGDAGVYKSWLVAYLATCVTLGRPFLGLPVLKGPVVYVDAELDIDEFTRRCYQIARGLGLTKPPEGLHYYRIESSLDQPEVIDYLRELIANVGARLTVVDSLSWASFGADLKDAGDVTAIIKGLETWGTVVALDHISKPLPGVNLSNYRPFASQFKYIGSRCITQVLRAESGKGLALRPVKTNFGPLGAPIGVEVNFDSDQVTFSRVDMGSDAMAGIGDHLPAKERVFQALAQTKTATPEDLANELGLKVGTVRNYLTALREENRVVNSLGAWKVKQADRHSQDSQVYRDYEPMSASSPANEPDCCAFVNCTGPVFRFTPGGVGLCEAHFQEQEAASEG